jgi:hypothetical protein
MQKRYIMGILYALVEIAAIVLFALWGKDALGGLISLGHTPMKDHSLVLMVYGILAAIIFAGFLVFWVGNIRTTYQNGLRIRQDTYARDTALQALKTWSHENVHMLFLIPGYAIALLLAIVVPSPFPSIAFDAGGVASGPMTAAFLLPFAMGACHAVGGNPATDAFGVVAFVAMTPLIAVQIPGLIWYIRNLYAKKKPADAEFVPIDEDIIDL